MSNDEPQQDGEDERNQARDSDVEVVVRNGVIDWGLVQWLRDDDRAALSGVLIIRRLRTGAMRAAREISTRATCA